MQTHAGTWQGGSNEECALHRLRSAHTLHAGERRLVRTMACMSASSFQLSKKVLREICISSPLNTPKLLGTLHHSRAAFAGVAWQRPSSSSTHVLRFHQRPNCPSIDLYPPPSKICFLAVMITCAILNSWNLVNRNHSNLMQPSSTPLPCTYLVCQLIVIPCHERYVVRQHGAGPYARGHTIAESDF
jgi:hypothetical protein